MINESLSGAALGAQIGARLGRVGGPEGMIMGLAIGAALGNKYSKKNKTKMEVRERPIQEMRGRSRVTLKPSTVYQGKTSDSVSQALHDLDAQFALLKKPKPIPTKKIAESRGRPALGSDEDGKEHDRHIIMQLRKAITIGKPITFANGEKKLVGGKIARQALHAHDSLRTTTEKARFEDVIKQSYDDLVNSLR